MFCFVLFFCIFYFIKELFESLDDNLDEDLLEALVALSLSTAQYDARTLNLAMKVSVCTKLYVVTLFYHLPRNKLSCFACIHVNELDQSRMRVRPAPLQHRHTPCALPNTVPKTSPLSFGPSPRANGEVLVRSSGAPNFVLVISVYCPFQVDITPDTSEHV